MQIATVTYPAFFFFFHATATTEIYTLSLHDALPISRDGRGHVAAGARAGARRGRRGPASDRDRAAAGRGGLGVRRARGREGANRESGRQVPDDGPAGRGGGGGRLRQGAVAGSASARAGVPRAQREGRR